MIRKYMCMSDACVDGVVGRPFEAEERKCPNCGAGAPVVVRVLTCHFLVVDVERGRIIGNKGAKKRLACDATGKKDVAWVEANYCIMTGSPEGVNCDQCRASPEYVAAYEACCENENYSHTIGGVKYGT